MAMTLTEKRAKAQLRPAIQNYQCSNGSGAEAELDFDRQCTDRGMFSMGSNNDIGIDRVIYFVDDKGKRVYKNVQITIGSENKNNGLYCINKPIERIRSDIDIVAIYIRHYSDRPNINTGKQGLQGTWLFVPIEVYCDERMFDNYYNTTNVFHVDINKKLLPPLDKALEAWYLLTRKKSVNAESFF